jgi:hypothetical protein
LSNSTKLLEIDTTISILTDTTILASKPMKHNNQMKFIFGEEKMKKRIVYDCFATVIFSFSWKNSYIY